MLEATEDLFVRHCAKPSGAFIILKFYNMFCRFTSPLPTCPHKYTTLYFHRRSIFHSKLQPIGFLLATFSRVIHRTFSYFTFPPLFSSLSVPLSVFPPWKLPGAVSKVSVRDFSAFIEVIKPLPMLLLSLNYFFFPIFLPHHFCTSVLVMLLFFFPITVFSPHNLPIFSVGYRSSASHAFITWDAHVNPLLFSTD